MSIYAIADLHLSLSSSKPMDIFDGWENYITKLKTNWKNTVKNEDTVVIAGDISWAMKLNDTLNDFTFIENLPGKKILLKGNHDYWWTTRNKIQTFFEKNNLKSLSILFNSTIAVGDVCICGTKGVSVDISTQEDLKLESRETIRLENSILQAEQLNKKPIVFLHYPPICCNKKSPKILNVLLKHNIKQCYYGHIHGKNSRKRAFEGTYQNIEFHLISCDHIGFTPSLVK